MRSYHIFRSWALETLTVALAIVLIASISGVLAFYNGKPVPNWGDNLNLNALLALLSTILRALLVIIVAQIISQRKWDWYSVKEPRPLADLQQFDYGSRGAYGAMLLVPTVLSKDHITLTAALVLLTSFLVGPCVQQASGIAPCSLPSSNISASLPFAHWVPGGGIDFPETSIPQPEIIAAIISSVVSPNGIENQVNMTCPTGNCTFGDLISGRSQDKTFNDDNRTAHSTVGMCNICTDVASLVTQAETPTSDIPWLKSLTLPNGFNFSIDSPKSSVAMMRPTPDLIWMQHLLTDSAREASRWAYVNATLVTSVSTPITASVCSLYPCMRTYTSIIKDNQLHEEQTQSEIMRIDSASRSVYLDENKTAHFNFEGNLEIFNAHSNNESGYASIKAPCRVGERTFHMEGQLPEDIKTTNLSLLDFGKGKTTSFNVTWPNQCIYRQDAKFVKAIATVMNGDIFDGYCDEFRICMKNEVSHGENYDSYMSNVGVGSILRSLASNETTHKTVTKIFDSIANAMTNRFRFQYGSTAPAGTTAEPSVSDLVQGKAWETKVCVSMRTEWLLLPIGLTFVTFILSMWTIITNWQHRHSIPIWKESILPLLFYGQDIAPRDAKALPIQPSDKDTGGDQVEGLMEASTMAAASRKIMVSFRFDGEKTHDTDDQVMSSTVSLLDQDSTPLRRQDSRVSSMVEF
ncbi:hypothetical protein AA0117_g9326 [Alternaria alternata]|jgi:hypothetical protein|uniref:Uncharacterized protein n=1 Tax=Alternaria alternata TaxID=5599 RepID=A0A4Q4N8E4_ALTAL|nr:hypothetical protein AA0117_g9326 [Alternaria alternata]